ncbi:Gigantea-like protein [Thalictrum thalictroides]|uniref:Gigantea-like protein n=1 Tax=Thalictrum thalictroides TaxID=46969 RepID=A0A7J6V5T3_THATH|nr:Gigantea-like protein [Thalictrum thalictroides]
MKCRLPATVRCLSHPSAHVRALSTSVLRDILFLGPIKFNVKQEKRFNGVQGPSHQCLSSSIIDWNKDIEKCLTWEARSRHTTGVSTIFLDAAAKDLGCTISI